MSTLQLVSWEKGLNSVALIEAVRNHSRNSLIDAKLKVERFIQGEIVILEFDDQENLELFRELAKHLGVGTR